MCAIKTDTIAAGTEQRREMEFNPVPAVLACRVAGCK